MLRTATDMGPMSRLSLARTRPTLLHHLRTGCQLISAGMARHFPWLDERTTLVANILTRKHGMQVDDDVRDAIRSDVLERLDFVAKTMRIGRHAAKKYVTDDKLAELANTIATQVRRGRVRGAHLRLLTNRNPIGSPRP